MSEICRCVLRDILVGLVSGLFILWAIEGQKKASLQIVETCCKTEEREKEGTFKYLGFVVQNPKMCKPFACLFDREPAMSCRLYLRFYADDSPVMFGSPDYPNDEIPVRWEQAVRPQYDGPCTSSKHPDVVTYRFHYIQHEIDIPQGLDRKAFAVICVQNENESPKYYIYDDRMMIYLGHQQNMPKVACRMRLDTQKKYRIKARGEYLGRPFEAHFALHLPSRTADGDGFCLEREVRHRRKWFWHR